MHEAHDKMSMYEYGNTNLIYTTITFWESLFSSFCPAKLDMTGSMEIQPLLV